jgi:23S rRNA pseudouridine1911/1915/1917 synthase
MNAPYDRTVLDLTVPLEADGARLDAFIGGAAPELSRTRAKALVLAGHVAMDGAILAEPKRAMRAGEHIRIALPPAAPAAPLAESIPLDIVHEDADLIVVDKPAGLVVHPAAGNPTGTLVNALIAHCGQSLSGIGGVSRPGIVHRLDKDTSGLMVVAKNDRAHRSLSAQFADHGRSGPLERAYLALVWGIPERREATIEAALGRSPKNREKMAIAKSGGRAAITRYRVLESYGPKDAPAPAALVECRLETGRTHQIRVHMAAIGHPLIGDRAYGSGFATKAARLPQPVRALAEAFPRQALHAWLLGFAHPGSGRAMHFERAPPADIAALIKAFKSM